MIKYYENKKYGELLISAIKSEDNCLESSCRVKENIRKIINENSNFYTEKEIIRALCAEFKGNNNTQIVLTANSIEYALLVLFITLVIDFYKIFVEDMPNGRIVPLIMTAIIAVVVFVALIKLSWLNKKLKTSSYKTGFILDILENWEYSEGATDKICEENVEQLCNATQDEKVYLVRVIKNNGDNKCGYD